MQTNDAETDWSAGNVWVSVNKFIKEHPEALGHYNRDASDGFVIAIHCSHFQIAGDGIAVYRQSTEGYHPIYRAIGEALLAQDEADRMLAEVQTMQDKPTEGIWDVRDHNGPKAGGHSMQTNAKRTSTRPGYVFDDHAALMLALFDLLDQAAVDYDRSEDVVDDFQAYVKDWARRRDEKPER